MQNHIEALSRKITQEKQEVHNEAATINAFVMPFIEMLGYDIHDPKEVVPEYSADLSFKGDCADLAILQNGKPQIVIECKHHTLSLGKNFIGQLSKYFAALPSAKLGILTNGIDYSFFTDSTHRNLMDQEPFFTFNLEHPETVRIEVLLLFSRSCYTPKLLDRVSIINRIKRDALHELSLPSAEIARMLWADLFYTKPEPKGETEPAGATCYKKVVLSSNGEPHRTIACKNPLYWERNSNLDDDYRKGLDIVKSLVSPDVADRFVTDRFKHSLVISLDRRGFRDVVALFFDNLAYIRISISGTRFLLEKIEELAHFKDEINSRVSSLLGNPGDKKEVSPAASNKSENAATDHERILSYIRNEVSGIVEPEKVMTNRIMNCWCSIKIDGVGNLAEVLFSERGKKWLLMNSIGFKQNIGTLSDIPSFGDQLRKAAREMLNRKG